MAGTTESRIAASEFLLERLFPKYVITSKGDLRRFNGENIAKSLVKETGLPENVAQEVGKAVIRKIAGLGLPEITTTYIRELTSVELTARGLHEARNKFIRLVNTEITKFRLDEAFLDQYRGKQPQWGPIGYFTFKRTYARPMEGENRTEEFWETARRVVEGCFSAQKFHCTRLSLPFDEAEAQKSAQIMFKKMWEFKLIAPGRGLWMMGTEFVDQRGSMALNNCGFVSTEDIDLKGSKAFEWTMDGLMLGVGVGFDTKGAGKIIIKEPNREKVILQVPDSREGWVESLGHVLRAYFFGNNLPELDYSSIRPAGAPIKGFGGVASGSGPLKEMHEDIKKLLESRIGQSLRSTDIVDLFNFIGKCVVAGNVRRSAEIALGSMDDEDYIKMKEDEAKVRSHRWASNNSVIAEIGMDYSKIAKGIAKNGEPGVLYLENARKYGRTGDAPDWKDKKAMGVNPCGEQTLESFELCCVSAETRIQAKNGIPKIGDVVGKEIELWNGDRWSRVVPFLAGENKDLIRVYLSDGSYLDCTPDHGWHIKPKTARIYRRVEAKDLKIGDKCISFEINETFEGIYELNAFEYGLFAGDGYIDKYYPMVTVCGEKAKLLELDIQGTWYKPQILEGYSDPVNRLNLKGIIDLDIAKELNDKNKGLPELIFSWDKESLKEFLAGWIETDGNICRQPQTDNIRLFGTELKLRDMQLLLRRIGINHSTLYCAGAAGEETNFGKRTYALYCLYIPTYECEDIPTKIKIVERIGNRYKINNAHPEGKKLDAARKQKIVKIEKLVGLHKTYCFSEPENHMGVFGNVITYQCLVETFPSRHDSWEEFQETLKYAYLYAKSVTLLNTHWKETNAVMGKNRRIGISQSGIIDAFVKHGRRTMLGWCDKGFKYLRDLDDKISDWLCIPKSIKITTVKPSGTVSLLPGVSPGIHYPHAEYYIRRVRVGKNSLLVPVLKEAGYHIEDDTYSKTAFVIDFPIHEVHFDRAKHQVSIWEQVQNAADYQRYWSDNQVSITVTFRAEEAKDIVHVLEAYEDKIKGLSMLPLRDHGYVQAPYEEITKEKYETMVKEIRAIDLGKTLERIAGAMFCDGENCMLEI